MTAKLAARPCAKSSIHWRALTISLKPIALAVAAIAALVTALGWWTVVWPAPTWDSVRASVVTYPYLPVLLAFDVGYFLLWASGSTRSSINMH